MRLPKQNTSSIFAQRPGMLAGGVGGGEVGATRHTRAGGEESREPHRAVLTKSIERIGRENSAVILSEVEGSRGTTSGFRNGIPRLRSEWQPISRRTNVRLLPAQS